MPTRQHIHLICDPKDPSLYRLQDALTIFCENRACLSKDLLCAGGDAANYSWRCINRCDAVFMLLGQSYGELTSTGVSQLHVSYLNSKTKHKPLAAFVLKNVEQPKRLSDLLHILTTQGVLLYPIDDNTDLPSVFELAYNALFFKSAQTPTPTQVPTPAKLPTTKKVVLSDEVLLNCTAHAFKGGTLIEVAFMAGTTWHGIIHALAQHNGSFSLQTLWRILSDLAATQAMGAVKPLHPEVHAISRCQITKADVLWVEDELLRGGLIQDSSPNSTGKPTWALTDSAKHALQNPKESI